MDKKIEIFKALSDEIRVRILNLFIKNDREICVCELIDALKLPQYTISKALNILKSAGLFTTEKKGLWVYYQLNIDDSVNKSLFDFLKDFLNAEILFEDEARLRNRLLLRKNDKCVVGTIPEEDLLRMIKEKIKV